MNWRFCPHCETQLDDATGICPACRWDPFDAPPPATAEQKMSLLERYRGTEYDSLMTSAPAMVGRQSHGPTTKFKLLMLASVLALLGLYGGMVAWTQMSSGVDQPAPAAVGAPR